MADLLVELTNFLGYLGDVHVIMDEGLNVSDRTQVRKTKLLPGEIKVILLRLLDILTDTPNQTTTSRPLPPDIMTKINNLHDNYKSSNPQEQQELREYIEEVIETLEVEEGDDQNGGFFTRKYKFKKSKLKRKTRKSKSKKSRNLPSY